MESLEEYRQNLIADIRAEAKENSQYDNLQFLETVTGSLSEDDKCPAAVICFYDRTLGKTQVQIHGYNYDDFDNTMSVFLSDFNGGPDLLDLNKGDYDNLIKPAKAFLEKSLSGDIERFSDCSDDGYGLAQEIRTHRDTIERYFIYVISDRRRGDRFKSIREMKVDGKPLFCRIFDIEYQYDSVKEKAIGDDIHINVRDISGFDAIPCMEASNGNVRCRSYLCVVPGQFLARAYREYGSRLLESNVRSYLGLKGGVNKGIKNTIQNEPELFFAFNNGITTTCTGVSITSDGITDFENLQIVNGGQTTVSIYNEWKRNPDSVSSVYVPMKLTVSDAEYAKAIVPRISQYANTQNAVKKSDLDSNDEFQKLMERYSRNTRIPQSNQILTAQKWYYERTRNQFEQDPDRQKDPTLFNRQYDKKRKIDKGDFAKYRCIIRMLPHRIATSKEDCYNKYFKPMVAEQWEKDQSFFSVDYYKETVAVAILYKKVYAEIPKRDWFGSRTSIKAPLTYYSISKLFYMLQERGYKLDLLRIWDTQSVDDVVIRQIASIAEVFSNYLDAIQSRGTLITQWTKKEQCWAEVKDLMVDFNEDILKVSVTNENYEKRAVRSRLTAQEVRDADEFNAFRTLSDGFWTSIELWCMKNMPLTAAQATLVKQVKSHGNLNSGQIRKLKELISSAVDRGYKNPELASLRLNDSD